MAGMVWCCSRIMAAVAVLAMAAAANNVRGVPPNRAILYDPSKDFTCFNGAQRIPFDQVNDDYCDCTDGSDEPGTSACANSVFYCANEGAKKMEIPSYRVNDGICDCCDASDEYGTGKCTDVCEEAGRAMREAAALEAKMLEEGLGIRQNLIARGVELKTEWKSKVQELEPKITELDTRLQGAEAEKSNAEAPEKAVKDEFDQSWEETLNQRKESARQELFALLDTDTNQNIELNEIQARIEFDSDANGEVSKEEAEAYFDDDGEEGVSDEESTMDFSKFTEKCYDKIKDKFQDTVPLADENKPDYDDNIKTLIEAADKARNAYNDINGELNKIKTERDSFSSKLEKDYGPESEWAAADGECFNVDVAEYNYEVCLFGKASQKPKGGGGNTHLGEMTEFSGPEGAKYSKIAFTGGTKCWNGPQRSLTVEVKCGSKGELSNVGEPSKCEYAGVFRHPAACKASGSEVHDEL